MLIRLILRAWLADTMRTPLCVSTLFRTMCISEIMLRQPLNYELTTSVRSWLALCGPGGGTWVMTVLSMLWMPRLAPVSTVTVLAVLTLTMVLTLVPVCLTLVAGRLTPPRIGTILRFRLIVAQ